VWASSNGNGPNFGGLAFPLMGLSFTLFLAERYCFLFFLRGTAVSMRREALGRQIVYYMVAVPVVIVLFVMLWFLLVCGGGLAMFGAATSATGAKTPGQASAAAGNAAGMAVGWFVAGITCGILEVLVALCMFVWYLVIIFQTRGAVSVWLADRE
jgi:hypothetical protein